MQIETTKDFKRPRARVLAQFRDPARFEAVLSDLGAQAERRGEPPEASWDCSLIWREAPRRFRVRQVETVADETMAIAVESDLATLDLTLDFYDLPDGGCRVMSVAEVTPRTVTVRLALQTLRLARGRAEERLKRFITVMGRG